MKNYYKILETEPNASTDAIKKAYRTLSKKFHPDINKNGIEQFKAINEANSILSDPAKRKAYDIRYNAYFKSKSTQQTSNSSTSNKGHTQGKSTSSSTIIINGVEINITGKNTSTNVRIVNGKVIVESTYH